MPNPSALLWKLGVALGEHGYLTLQTASLGDDPEAWILSNTEYISTIVKQEQQTLSMDDIAGLEGMLFPRLTLYMYGRSRLIGDSVNERNLNALLHRHKAEYTSIYDIAPLSPKTIGETLPKCLGENLKTSLSRSETEHVTTMYKLDILSIAARALVVFSSIKHIELKLGPTHSELQDLIDLLQETIDFGHLGDARPPICAALYDLCRKSNLHSTKLMLINIIKASRPLNGTDQHVSAKAYKGKFGDEDVAIKLTKACIQDAIIWRQFDHPNVLSIFGLDTSLGNLYVISPWMSQGNVTQYLTANLEVDRMSLVLDVARGLQYLHEFNSPIIHGNLKLENILISNSLSACISDYDLMPSSQVATQRNTGMLGGQSNGCDKKTEAQDICAFSTVLYEIMVHPLSVASQHSPLTRPFVIDDTVWKIMQECWSLDPPSIGDVLKNISHYLAMLPSDEDLPVVCDTDIRVQSSMFDLPDWTFPDSTLPTLLGQDESVLSLNPTDIIIVVTGPSGSGKSSFINHLFGSKVAYVHDDLESCTRKVNAFACMHPHRRNQKVVIVDTPGFDDSTRTDYDILEEIARWLETTYRKKILLSGLLQFHNISDSRMRGAPLRNLDMFQNLCGKDAIKNVVLLTTFWDRVLDDVGADRENQLQAKFWQPLIVHGSRVDQFNPPTHERAWDIIDRFPPNTISRPPLMIQKEMVDQKKKLYETSVFKKLKNFWRKTLNKIAKKFATGNKAPQNIDIQRAFEQNQAFDRQPRSSSSPASSMHDLKTR